MRSLAIDSSLDGIAGVPLAMLTVPNTASSPLNIGPTEARTLYAVASTSAQSTNAAVANIGSDYNDSNGFVGGQVIRTQGPGIGGLANRGQTIGGGAILQNMVTGWPWNTPVAVCGWWDGNRFGSQGYRSNPTASAPTTGSMNSAPRLRMASTASNGTTPIAALAYRGVHDLATRTRIINWLMQRYGNL